MRQELRADTAVADITVLIGKKHGQSLVKPLDRAHVPVLPTFAPDEDISRRQQRAFCQGAAQIKATTVHSFKGWEARHLVVFVERAQRAEERALIDTGLTRLRRHRAGSALTVVNCCSELSSYGQTWPEFIAIDKTCQSAVTNPGKAESNDS